MIKKDGITITNFYQDETGRFPVDPKVYYKKQLEQQHALRMLMVAVGNLMSCTMDDEDFHQDLAKKNWFNLSLDDLQYEVTEALYPDEPEL